MTSSNKRKKNPEIPFGKSGFLFFIYYLFFSDCYITTYLSSLEEMNLQEALEVEVGDRILVSDLQEL
jgi:hypothetical protein